MRPLVGCGWRHAASRVALLACLALWATNAFSSDRKVITPIDSDRVVVERVVAKLSDVRSRAARWLSTLTGQPDEPLFSRPFGVSWDGSDLLVSDPAGGRVLRISDRGQVDASPEGLLENPIGVAPCRGGVLVTDSARGRVVLLDQNLKSVSWERSELERPTGVGCVGDEIVVVETAAHRIVFFDRDGKRREFGQRGTNQGEFNFPGPIAFLPGEIVVGDTLNFRLQRFTLDGRFLGEFGKLGDAPGSMPRIKAIATDSEQRIWVSDAVLDQLAVYEKSGRLLMIVGHSGSEPGGFLFPAGLAFDPSGRLAVVDSLNHRVQLLRIREDGR